MKVKKTTKFIFMAVLMGVTSSCSIKQMAYKSIANGIAPVPEKKAKIKVDPNAPNPILALTGEDDIELVGEVFPVILKTYEAMHIQDPKHRGLALMTGELYIMYSNIFVETPANYFSDNEFDKKNTALFRAKKFYQRGTKATLSSLDLSYPGFAEAIESSDPNRIEAMLSKCKPYDVEALHWSGAGILAAFSIDPLDVNTSQLVIGAVAMLEKVCSINPEYSNGATWEILTKFYAAAPDALGGGIEKAENAYKKAYELCNGKNPSIYVTYAQSFCIPKQDSKGFDKAIKSALDIDPSAQPESRLQTTLSQNYAKWLKEHKQDFILGE